MLRFGIRTRDQFLRAGKRRRFAGSRVAFNLLNVVDNPNREDVEIFEDIHFTLRTSNGTCRTTFRNRLRDVDEFAINILEGNYSTDSELLVEDRASSHGLTSIEFAQRLFAIFPNAHFQASDRLLYLVEVSLPTGESFVLEPDGTALQYVKPPFVVSLAHRESRYLPVNRFVAAWGRRRLSRLPLSSGQRTSKISCVHPEVVAFEKSNPSFSMKTRSVFDVTTNGVHLIRTVNILNKGYFSEELLKQGADAIFQSLKQNGIWIVGRTLEDDFTNHVSFFQKMDEGWQLLGRLGEGSELESLIQLSHSTARPVLAR